MSTPQQPPQTVKFIIGINKTHFVISKQAVFERSPYFKWVFSDSGTIASETGVVAVEEVQPKIFKYLEEYFNTGFINSLDDQAEDAVMVLAKLWVLAEFA